MRPRTLPPPDPECAEHYTDDDDGRFVRWSLLILTGAIFFLLALGISGSCVSPALRTDVQRIDEAKALLDEAIAAKNTGHVEEHRRMCRDAAQRAVDALDDHVKGLPGDPEKALAHAEADCKEWRGERDHFVAPGDMASSKPDAGLRQHPEVAGHPMLDMRHD